MYRDGCGLTDSIRAVFSLPMISWHPIEIVEDDLPRRREIQPDAAGNDVGYEHPAFRIALESIDHRLALLRVRRARYDNCSVAEMFRDFLDRFVEAREHECFLTLCDGALDQVYGVFNLGRGEFSSRTRDLRN